MNDLELEQIRNIANEVRNEILNKRIKFVCSEEFPKGCCGNASEILKLYLTARGFQEVQYVNGQKKNQSHAWLEYKGYIIDITADQFLEYTQEPVTIIPKRESAFHRKFKNNKESDEKRKN